ncbi:hypothetical protein SPB21_07090 [Leptothoe sp. ISB3NOV94-8A]
MNKELSLDVAVAIEKYRQGSSLSAAEHRHLQILDSAIADGCIIPIGHLDHNQGIMNSSSRL